MVIAPFHIPFTNLCKQTAYSPLYQTSSRLNKKANINNRPIHFFKNVPKIGVLEVVSNLRKVFYDLRYSLFSVKKTRYHLRILKKKCSHKIVMIVSLRTSRDNALCVTFIGQSFEI